MRRTAGYPISRHSEGAMVEKATLYEALYRAWLEAAVKSGDAFREMSWFGQWRAREAVDRKQAA
ncbi:hypothetical protein GCM10009099_14140 [Caenispirillum bisanense]